MKLTARTVAMMLGCAVAASGIRAFGEDWPQWRGANHDAKVTDFKPPETWPKELTQKWKAQVGEGVATPALVGGKIYVFSRDGNSEVTRCIESETGKILWQDKYETQEAQVPAKGFSGPRSSPAVADGKVVTLGVRGMLSCLDASSGKKIWRKDDFRGSAPRFFAASSPIIVDGLVIAQLGGNDGAVVAYDLNTGEQKWKSANDPTGYASPTLMTLGGTKLIIAETDRRVVALNAADGKQVWEAAFQAGGPGDYNSSSPVVDGQTLIYSAGKRGTHAVKFAKDGEKITGKSLWNSDQSLLFASPVVKDGMVYGLSSGNDLFCLNGETGTVAWTQKVGSGGGGGGPGGGGPGGGGPGGGRPGGRPGGPGGPGGGQPGGPGGGQPGGPGGGGFRRPGGGGGGMGRGGGMGGMGGYGSIVDAGSVMMALTPSAELVVFKPGEKYTEVARIKLAAISPHAYPILSGKQIIVKDADSVEMMTME